MSLSSVVSTAFDRRWIAATAGAPARWHRQPVPLLQRGDHVRPEAHRVVVARGRATARPRPVPAGPVPPPATGQQVWSCRSRPGRRRASPSPAVPRSSRLALLSRTRHQATCPGRVKLRLEQERRHRRRLLRARHVAESRFRRFDSGKFGHPGHPRPDVLAEALHRGSQLRRSPPSPGGCGPD